MKEVYLPLEIITEMGLWRLFPVINVDKCKEIPCDYPGAMGVPITIVDKLSREQFEVLDCVHHVKLENGRHPYRRVVIRNLRPDLADFVDVNALLKKAGSLYEIEVRDIEMNSRHKLSRFRDT
ncbi:MAG: hypothetical protein DBY17_03260 [Oscillospiraceae bacterium]|nr:MAG: hypothetical protein DBY17_03260 [Oscillospiraceae bacterium]